MGRRSRGSCCRPLHGAPPFPFEKARIVSSRSRRRGKRHERGDAEPAVRGGEGDSSLETGEHEPSTADAVDAGDHEPSTAEAAPSTAKPESPADTGADSSIAKPAL